MEEVKPPPMSKAHRAWLRSEYMKACQDGIHVSRYGAMCDKGVYPSMVRLCELRDIADQLGSHECEMIAMRVWIWKQKKETVAVRKISHIAIAIAVVSMLLSLSPIL